MIGVPIKDADQVVGTLTVTRAATEPGWTRTYASSPWWPT